MIGKNDDQDVLAFIAAGIADILPHGERVAAVRAVLNVDEVDAVLLISRGEDFRMSDIGHNSRAGVVDESATKFANDHLKAIIERIESWRPTCRCWECYSVTFHDSTRGTLQMSEDDFSWSDARKEGQIVVPEQAAIAVYENPNGDVVIRQEAQMHPDEDHFVYVQHTYLPRLIAALEQARLKRLREPPE